MKGKARHISGIVANGDRLRRCRLAPSHAGLDVARLVAVLLRRAGRDARGSQRCPSSAFGGAVLPRLLHAGARRRARGATRTTTGAGRMRSSGSSSGRHPESGGDSEGRSRPADYAIDGVATGLSSQLEARFGQGSAAAKAGRRQFFANRTLGVIYLALNPERPLFKDVRLRKAVNYAIDRRALARLGTPLSRNPDRPTDQYLPPGMPGFTDVRVYPFTPSLARAKNWPERRIARPCSMRVRAPLATRSHRSSKPT